MARKTFIFARLEKLVHLGWSETAESSHLAYKKTISVFLDFLAEQADRDLADLTRSDIIRFRNELSKRLGADTVNRYVKIVRMFFKSAHRDGYLLENPAEHVDAIRDRSKDARRRFTIAELQAVMAVKSWSVMTQSK